MIIFFFNDTATTEIYTRSLHDALPISDNKKVIISLEDEGDKIGFFVADLGDTIKGDDKTAIFSRSVQLANGESRGSGLGLAIVKRIAEVHGAEIGVKSNEPSGNIFYMKLPKSVSSHSVVKK